MFINVMDDSNFSMPHIVHRNRGMQYSTDEIPDQEGNTVEADEFIPQWEVWNDVQAWTESAQERVNELSKILFSLSKNYYSMAGDICGLTLQLPAFRGNDLNFERTQALVTAIAVRPVPSFNVGCRLDSLNEICSMLCLFLNGLCKMISMQKNLLITEHGNIHSLHLKNEMKRPASREDIERVRMLRGAWIQRKQTAETKVEAERVYVKTVVDDGLHQILYEMCHIIEGPSL
jgi:hypothetical protein